MTSIAQLAALTVVTAILGTGSWAQETFTIKFSADSSSSGDVCQNIIPPWKEAIETSSDGRLKVEVFCDGVLGKMGDTVDRVSSGIAQAGWDLPFAYGARFGALNVIGLPGLYEDTELASGALWKFYESDPQGVKSALEAEGVKLIWTQAVPNSSLFMTEKLEDNLDLDGAKIAIGTQTRALMVDAHGGVPIRVGVPDYYNSLSRGVVDGTWTTTAAIASYHVDEITDYYLFGPFGGGYTFAFMNLDFYNSLPDDLKAVIDAASGYERSRATGRHIFDFEEAYMRDTMLAREGTEQHFLTEEEQAAWEPTFEAARNSWVEATEGGEALLSALSEILESEATMHGN